MRLTIEIDPHSQPMAGWLQADGEPRQEFVGFLELISMLEELRDGPRPVGPARGIGRP